MALFEHTDKQIELPIDVNKQKKLSKILGTDFMLRQIRTLTGKELGNFRVGSTALAIMLGTMGYYFYRQYYKQKMMSSTGYYKLMNRTPINAGEQFWWNIKEDDKSYMFTSYYRMPKKEYDIRYRNKSAYISGQFDHDKEILLPREKNGIEGYDVITPFYYYYKKSSPSYLSQLQDGKPAIEHDVERAAIAVFRGW